MRTIRRRKERREEKEKEKGPPPTEGNNKALLFIPRDQWSVFQGNIWLAMTGLTNIENQKKAGVSHRNTQAISHQQ